MTARQVAKRLVHRVFAWVLLLALGIASILGGIAIVGSGYWSTFVVRTSDAGATENVVMFLITLSIGFGLYVIRGVSSGAWAPPVGPTLMVLASALLVLAFGDFGLPILIAALLALHVCLRFLANVLNRNDD